MYCHFGDMCSTFNVQLPHNPNIIIPLTFLNTNQPRGGFEHCLKLPQHAEQLFTLFLLEMHSRSFFFFFHCSKSTEWYTVGNEMRQIINYNRNFQLADLYLKSKTNDV